MNYLQQFLNLLSSYSTMSVVMIFLLPIFTACALSSLIEHHYAKDNEKPYSVVIDTKKIAMDFSKSVAENKNITDDEKVALVSQFDAIYPTILQQYAKKNNVIIFDSSIPLQIPNSKIDVTTSVENAIENKMEKNSIFQKTENSSTASPKIKNKGNSKKMKTTNNNLLEFFENENH